MVRIKTERTLAQTQDTSLFNLVDAGTYTGVIKSVELGSYRAGFKGHEGTFTYRKIVPTVHILDNANNLVAIVMHQDYTIGVFDDDDNLLDMMGEGNPLFGGWRGVLPILTALNFVQQVGDNEYDVEIPDWSKLVDIVARVSIAPGAYSLESKRNFTPFDVASILQSYGYPAKGVTAAAAQKCMEQYSQDIGETLRLKNVITGWYAPGKNMAEANHFFFKDNRVWLTEASYNAFVNDDSSEDW